jgi:hypothetical protein
MVCVNVNVTCGFSRDRVVALTRLLCRVTPKVAKLHGCEPNVKVPDYSDGTCIHHGTNAWNLIWGIRRSPESGDPMWGSLRRLGWMGFPGGKAS